jgi:UPF0176 protein
MAKEILHNKVSNLELKNKLLNDNRVRITVSFYQYYPIEDVAFFRNDLYKKLFDLAVFGRIYVANEGINAQISVLENQWDSFKNTIYSYPFLNNIRLNKAIENEKSFWVLKIKIRDKIVADGIDDASFSMKQKGNYVDAATYNKLTEDTNTVVVDMRNYYEYEVGHFENAIEVPSDTFREQLPMAAKMLEDKKENNIIMYCTGGIRCEKASAYLLHQGFKNVFHLEGGIIEYANTVKAKGLTNKFKGKNFVFDNRLGEKIGDEIISQCHQCQTPCDTHVNCANEACHLLFIQCNNCKTEYSGCCSKTCYNFKLLPENEQKEKRKGLQNGIMVFNKGKERLRPIIKKS